MPIVITVQMDHKRSYARIAELSPPPISPPIVLPEPSRRDAARLCHCDVSKFGNGQTEKCIWAEVHRNRAKIWGAPMGKVDPGWPALFIVLCELSNDSLSKDPCQFLHAFLAAV
jgi:hypothetical protein